MGKTFLRAFVCLSLAGLLNTLFCTNIAFSSDQNFPEFCKKSSIEITNQENLHTKIDCRTDLITRSIFNLQNELIERQVYRLAAPLKVHVQKVLDLKIYDQNGALIYDSSISEPPQDLRMQSNIPPDASTQDLNIAMMDDGLDISHPLISPYLLRNQNEILDGLDNDHDHLIDDLYGLSYKSMYGEANNVSAFITFEPDTFRPFSHGTHVASLMTKGTSKISLTTYTFPEDERSMDLINTYYKSVTSHMKKMNIRVLNMSLGSNPNLSGPPPVVSQAISSYKKLKTDTKIFLDSNPNVLFVVAAGNGFYGTGIHLDETSYPTLPASLPSKNMLVVGALASSKLDSKNMSDYEMSDFSNYGIKSVDILAPGKNVLGAQLGGGNLMMSGTSMASPTTINKVVVPIMQAFPKVSIQELIQITLLTASIPNIDLPFPVKSGGIINPERAMLAAKKLSDLKNKLKSSLTNIVLNILKAEGFSNDHIGKRVELWKKRGLI